ncbi:RNA-binding S4 domain-containing protein [endosymbiont of Ridgeia piscesae]|jgi:ribosome-associated heat shock protein Hsp15|uniref:Heat shock protein 15 n=1 Tax=endosymbiont of Ridgeia piscesae TaxID=54398 RepID=A0A0T5YYM4_9GAMM|nr:RNA-binding S4 domain-containing protein [endosymbiont of Ridgeia piscesae]KRT55583.1 heat shock protein Hsp15 [endosymbiont of Ridgeia piscesae]KRT56785.1 heat shock protein Hsp15 [endosymbiont of Ridgeia piscesae]
MQGETAKVRLDKWLWAARFFKTRQLACEAINGGKVHLNGQRTKPGKEIKAGSQLRIHKGSLEWELEVKVAASKRRPAEEAKTFYVESEESFLRRQRLTQELREQRAVEPHSMRGKPSKRDRRMIHRFTAKGE